MSDHNSMKEDRLIVLKERIARMKQESVDLQFNQYLDQVLCNIQVEETNIQKIELYLQQNYELYQRKNGIITESAPQQNVQNIQNAQNIPPKTVVKAPQSRSLEFKIGTFVLGVVGIVFLLIAFVTFGRQYMSSTLQGIFFYLLGIGIFAFSELFMAKRIEKFSYFLSGLGISSLYITTILNYMYLKIFPAMVALAITAVITGFFFFLSYKKDSGMIRIICLLGCYVSLVPLGNFENIWEFAVLAIIIFALNLAGIICPTKSKSIAIDYMQYFCTVILSYYLVHLMSVSDMEMWPVYIMAGSNLLNLYCVCLKRKNAMAYRLLYLFVYALLMIILLMSGQNAVWQIYGVIAVVAMGAVFTFLYRNTAMRFDPYIATVVYCIFVCCVEESLFYMTVVSLVVFVINRMLTVLMDGFEVEDAVFTMFAAIFVCTATRSGDVQFLGYVFAAAILVGAFFADRFKKYHLYTAVSFAWLFLLSEEMYPLVCSVLICALASMLIGGGFYKKDKAVRIYGLVLMIFVALKLVAYDFKEAEALTRIIVFSVVGALILGVSFLYIFLEKKENEHMQPKITDGQ